MNRLMVSYDAGCTYQTLVENSSIDVLVKEAKNLDALTRWCIKNENGEINTDYLCPIYKSTLDIIGRDRNKIKWEENPKSKAYWMLHLFGIAWPEDQKIFNKAFKEAIKVQG